MKNDSHKNFLNLFVNQGGFVNKNLIIKYDDEKAGIVKFLQIVEQLKNFTIVNFGWEDIVRSDFVRDYIMTKEMLGY